MVTEKKLCHGQVPFVWFREYIYSELFQIAEARSPTQMNSLYRLTARTLPRSHFAQRSFSSSARLNNEKSAVDFGNTEEAFRSKSTLDLFRSYAVFKACGFKPLVKHSSALTKLSYKLLGENITNTVLRATFFRHFCGVSSFFYGVI